MNWWRFSVSIVLLASVIVGAEPAKSPEPKSAAPAVEKTAKPGKLTPLNKQGTVVMDPVGKRLLLKGRVCLRKGTLELLCCLKQTKEHESIFSVDTKADVVHAGLLAIGAEQGKPVEYEPQFKPPTGQQIDIFVTWKDEKGKEQRVPGQDLIRYVTHRFFSEKLEKLPSDVKITERLDELRYDTKNKELIWYGPMTEEAKKKFLAMSKDKDFKRCIEQFYKRTQPKQMDAHWVFSGSSFYEDEETKQKFYRAEDGDLICVANFGSATIDVATRSGNGSEDLLFEAWTERIPAVDTPVTIELIPVAAKSEKAAKPVESKPAETKKP